MNRAIDWSRQRFQVLKDEIDMRRKYGKEKRKLEKEIELDIYTIANLMKRAMDKQDLIGLHSALLNACEVIENVIQDFDPEKEFKKQTSNSIIACGETLVLSGKKMKKLGTEIKKGPCYVEEHKTTEGSDTN